MYYELICRALAGSSEMAISTQCKTFVLSFHICSPSSEVIALAKLSENDMNCASSSSSSFTLSFVCPFK